MAETDTDVKADAGTDEDDDVRAEMERVEEDPPKKLEDWPGGKAKYKTLGGGEHEEGYGEGPTEALGPANLVHHEDGSVTIDGEKVDNPEDYKGDPIPGGPTDPDAPPDPGFENEDAADRAEEKGTMGGSDSEGRESSDSDEDGGKDED